MITRVVAMAFATCIAAFQTGMQDSQPASKPSSRPTTQSAPTTRPTHEPKAIELFDKMVKSIYRPRANGLLDIRCKIGINARTPTGESQDIGPILLEWEKDKIRVTDIKSNQPFRLGADVVLDLVGYEPRSEADRCHVAMKGENQIVMKIPEWVEKRPFDHHLFTVDSFDRPLSDEIVDASGRVLMTTLFGYDPEGTSPFLIMSRTRTQGQSEVVAIYEYTQFKDFRLLNKTINKLANGNVMVINYSDFEVNTGLKLE